jgi:putative intracellular protease/amidase/nitroreductase
MKRAVVVLAILACPGLSLPSAAQPVIEETGATYDFDLRTRTIAVVMADGVEYNEATVIPGYWRSWGARIVYVGTAHQLKAEEMVVSDRGFVPQERTIGADVLLQDFDGAGVDLIYLPGGESPRALLEQHRTEAIGIVRAAHRRKTMLGAFCHGPAVLLAADVVRGRRVAAEINPDSIRAAGGIPVAAAHVEDGHILTGNFPFMESFAVAVARKLSGRPSVVTPAERAASLEHRFGLTEHFIDKEVPDTVLRQIVQDAMLTTFDFPMNLLKPWTVIAVKNKQLRTQVSAALKEQFHAFYAARGIPEAHRSRFLDPHIDAPVYLVVTMKKQLLDPRIGTYEASPELAYRQQTLAAGAFTDNLRVLAAKAGLGSNLAQGLPFLVAESRIATVLALPANSFIAAVVSLGYPAQQGLPQPIRPAGEQFEIR